MHTLVRSPLSAGVAVAVAGAVAIAPPPAVSAPAPVVAEYRLAADPVPIGGLVTSFLGNQLIYCSIICPDVVKLAATVPVGCRGCASGVRNHPGVGKSAQSARRRGRLRDESS